MPVCISSSRSARPPPALFEVFVAFTLSGTNPGSQSDFSAKIQLCLIDCITCCWKCLENFTWCQNMKKTQNKTNKTPKSIWFKPFSRFDTENGWFSCRMGVHRRLLMQMSVSLFWKPWRWTGQWGQGGCWTCKVKVLTCPKLWPRSVRTSGTMSSPLSYQSLLQSLAQWHLFCCYYISKAFPPSLTISMTH